MSGNENQSSGVKKTGFFPRVPGGSWGGLAFMWLVFALNGNTREIFTRTSAAIIEEFNISSTTYGYITALICIAGAFLSLAGGRLSDIIGFGWRRKYSNLIVVIVYITFTVVLGFPVIASSVFVFVLLFVIKATFSGLGETIEVTTAAEWWPAENRGFVLGFHHTAYPWGTFIGGLIIAAILAGTGDWRQPYIWVPLAMIPIYVAYWFWASKKRFDRTNEQIEKMGLTPTVTIDKAPKANADVKEPGALAACFKNANVVGSFVLCFVAMAAYYGINMWITPYLAFVAGYDTAQAAAYGVFFYITGGLGQIIWGILGDRYGRKRVTIICFVWLAVAFLIMQNISISLAWLVGAQLICGFGLNALFPIIYSISTSSIPAKYGATAMSFPIMGASIGGGVMVLILGKLIEIGGGWESITGYMFFLYALVIVCAAAAVYCLLFTREGNGAKRGKDFALISFKACNIEDLRDKKR